MELRQLRYLVLLAEEQNFTRAARRANVAQPALSRQIMRLERELGVTLVNRTTRRVAITGPGQPFVDRARTALAELDDATAELQDVKELSHGHLAVGLTPTPGPIHIAAILGAFHRQYPGVELSLVEDLSITLTERLRNDTLDVAFISAVPPDARTRLHMQPLGSEPVRLVASTEHPLSKRHAIDIDALRNEPFVAFPRGATIRETLETAARAHGFVPSIAFETTSTTRARDLAAENLGVTLLPQSEATTGPGLASVPMLGDEFVHQMFIARRAARTPAPATRALLKSL